MAGATKEKIIVKDFKDKEGKPIEAPKNLDDMKQFYAKTVKTAKDDNFSARQEEHIYYYDS